MKLKKCMRDYPIPACIGVAAVSFLLLAAVSFLRKQLPEREYIDRLHQAVYQYPHAIGTGFHSGLWMGL